MILILTKLEPVCYLDSSIYVDVAMCQLDVEELKRTLREEGCEYEWIEMPRHIIIKLKRCKRYDWIDDYRQWVSVMPEGWVCVDL